MGGGGGGKLRHGRLSTNTFVKMNELVKFGIHQCTAVCGNFCDVHRDSDVASPNFTLRAVNHMRK